MKETEGKPFINGEPLDLNNPLLCKIWEEHQRKQRLDKFYGWKGWPFWGFVTNLISLSAIIYLLIKLSK